MAIDKGNSPVWVRITVWILIIGLVAGIGILGAIQVAAYWGQTDPLAQQPTATPTAEDAQKQVAQIDAQYQTETETLQKAVEAKPDDKDTLVKIATAYSNWGAALVQIQDQNAQATGMVRFGQSREFWQKAWDIDPKDKEVGGDFASALYYSGDTTTAIETARKVLDLDPKYGVVWFNLGMYLAQSQPQAAIEAFTESIKYDTDKKYTDQANQYIELLKAETK
jgi:tetratricopeptide (TPR) repeat protein